MSREKPELMTLNIRLFASLREIAGKGQITLRFSRKDEITIGDLMKKITEIYPVILSQKIPVAVAVNGTMASHNSVLKDLDEVALLPPVSGG